ncbi:MAG: Rieske 2Fe-2S domain-containing protein [Acidimicrobiia bacterium]|nr:Rieske 2Fe-2S domain-containing protein [Acidimicrobiia bacterium]
MIASTLPASWYVDPGIAAAERRDVFGREWLCIGRDDALRRPGDYVATDVCGWQVLVVVDGDGRLRGHHNVCRHRAGPLVAAGCGSARSLVCRYHGWAYGLDGALRSARDFGAADGELDLDALSLHPVRVERWRSLLFVNVDLHGDAPPLLDALGTFADACQGFPMESLQTVAELEHPLACNWKTYADNYHEGYHVPLVHPGLNKEIDARRYEVTVDEAHRWVRHDAPARDGAVNEGRWLWRWPNLALNLYPSAMNVERYEPLDPGRCRLRYTYAAAPGIGEDELAAVLRVSGEITAEDVAICEAVQRGLASGAYDVGVLSPRHEGAVAAFHRWVRFAVDPASARL